MLIEQPCSVVEFGVGYGSSYLFLDRECDLLSVESDPEWTARFRHKVVDDSYRISKEIDLVLVDCHPSSMRAQRLQESFRWAKTVVVHDTEPGSEKEYRFSSVKIPVGWLRANVTVAHTWTSVFSRDPMTIAKVNAWQRDFTYDTYMTEIKSVCDRIMRMHS